MQDNNTPNQISPEEADAIRAQFMGTLIARTQDLLNLTMLDAARIFDLTNTADRKSVLDAIHGAIDRALQSHSEFLDKRAYAWNVCKEIREFESMMNEEPK